MEWRFWGVHNYLFVGRVHSSWTPNPSPTSACFTELYIYRLKYRFPCKMSILYLFLNRKEILCTEVHVEHSNLLFWPKIWTPFLFSKISVCLLLWTFIQIEDDALIQVITDLHLSSQWLLWESLNEPFLHACFLYSSFIFDNAGIKAVVYNSLVSDSWLVCLALVVVVFLILIFVSVFVINSVIELVDAFEGSFLLWSFFVLFHIGLIPAVFASGTSWGALGWILVTVFYDSFLQLYTAHGIYPFLHETSIHCLIHCRWYFCCARRYKELSVLLLLVWSYGSRLVNKYGNLWACFFCLPLSYLPFLHCCKFVSDIIQCW